MSSVYVGFGSAQVFIAVDRGKNWPSSTDIAAQANVGFRVNCGSDRRGLDVIIYAYPNIIR
jgi:hypothetical protein